MLGMHLTYQYCRGKQKVQYPWEDTDGLFRFLDAVPTAELEPITETYVQADEARIFPLLLIMSH